jgi:hypothetical protein
MEIAIFTSPHSDLLFGYPWYTGYIYCSEPLSAELYELVNTMFHGGITFEQSTANPYCYGFDTMHSQDMPQFGGTPKSLEYVENILVKTRKAVLSFYATE